jgi:HSF-type DNA-binding
MTFPERLYRLVNDSDNNGTAHIVSFLEDGSGFKINNRKAFLAQLIPKYFKIKRYTSFRRQMYLYGFLTIQDGPHSGAYYHKYFIRGKPETLYKVRRQKKTLAATLAASKA